MRKGFALVEILVVVFLLSIVSVCLAGLFTALIMDIPRSYQVIQENTSVLDMLRQMQKDIDGAKELPESFGEYVTDDKHLLIESADAVFCYQLKDDEVLRRRLTVAQGDSTEDTAVWSVPHARVEWQVWKKNGKGYAVEVRTHIEHKVRGHLEKKMANSHLCFVGAFPEALE